MTTFEQTHILNGFGMQQKTNDAKLVKPEMMKSDDCTLFTVCTLSASLSLSDAQGRPIVDRFNKNPITKFDPKMLWKMHFNIFTCFHLRWNATQR